MRILMLSPILPWPLNMGGKIRVYYVLRELARAGHNVMLVTLTPESYKPEYVNALNPYCTELHVISIGNRSRLHTALKSLFSSKPYGVAKFDSPWLRMEVSHALKRNYDVLWVHFMETMVHLPHQFSPNRKPFVVLDQHNADERFWATYMHRGALWVRLFAWQNLMKLRRFQQRVLQHVDVVLSVSEEDAEFTRLRLPNKDTEVLVVPNGVDIDSLKPDEKSDRRNRVVLCGAMDVLMNIDAAEWFARRIFPRVKEVIPDAEFWIVGRNPSYKVKTLETIPGIYVTGSVEDVRPYYAQAKVAVAPFRYGGGTKIKVLEAMALGVPVVATPVGCQGIRAIPERHLFIENDEESFAERVVLLLRDESVWRELANEARQLVEEHYNWSRLLCEVIHRIEQCVQVYNY